MDFITVSAHYEGLTQGKWAQAEPDGVPGFGKWKWNPGGLGGWSSQSRVCGGERSTKRKYSEGRPSVSFRALICTSTGGNNALRPWKEPRERVRRGISSHGACSHQHDRKNLRIHRRQNMEFCPVRSGENFTLNKTPHCSRLTKLKSRTWSDQTVSK